MTDSETIVRQGLERVELEQLTLAAFHGRRERRRRNERIAAGAVGGLIVISMAIITISAVSDDPIDIGGGPRPAPPAADMVGFSSHFYGYSILHPEGWNVNEPTAAWTTGALKPYYADHLLDAAQTPLMDAGSIAIPDGMTSAEWIEREGRRAARHAGFDGSAFTSHPTIVDGEPAQLSENCNVVLVVKDRRGYVFRFYASLATNTVLRDVVRSIELHPEEAEP